ncbi:MAG: restriction endonuclease subunit S [Clostridiales bacterium]|jgi:type I restriction enzyme S subunit|nr:restriction endonuclease subunit S [Clostridiales bacterium]
MALIRLGELIELSQLKNKDRSLGLNDLRGISIQKVFIDSKADMDGKPLTSYLCVPHDYFAYVTVTSRNSEKITLAHNKSNDTYIVSSSYQVFKVTNINTLLPDYLFMFFNRPEFDRYARFNSWGSARETFGWQDLCDTVIDLPELQEQQKVVAVYNALNNNQQVYEKGLDDLKLVCDATIEKLRREMESVEIGGYITERIESNSNAKYVNLIGIGQNGFIEPNQGRTNESLKKCNVFYKDDFVYAPSSLTSGVIDISKFDAPMICTEEYIVFYVSDRDKLIPEYLLMFTKRSEFGRRIWFNSMDSVRNRYYFKSLQEETKIPLPSVEIQQSIVDIYNAYIARKEINQKLKQQLKDICAILITGIRKNGG